MAKHQLLTAIACTLALVAAAPTPMAEPVVGLRLVKRAPQAEEAEDPNKLDLTAKFNEQVALQGGNIQQDTTFPPGVSTEKFLPCLSLYRIVLLTVLSHPFLAKWCPRD